MTQQCKWLHNCFNVLSAAHTSIRRAKKLHDSIICTFRVQHILLGDWVSHQNGHSLPGGVKSQGVQHLKHQVIPRWELHSHAVGGAGQQNEAICLSCIHQGCLIWTFCLIAQIIWGCFRPIALGWNMQWTCLSVSRSLCLYRRVKMVLLFNRVYWDGTSSLGPVCPGGEHMAKRVRLVSQVWQSIQWVIRLMGVGKPALLEQKLGKGNRRACH